MEKCRRMKRPQCVSKNWRYSWLWKSSKTRQQFIAMKVWLDKNVETRAGQMCQENMSKGKNCETRAFLKSQKSSCWQNQPKTQNQIKMRITTKNGETRAIPKHRNGCKNSERILWMTEFLNTNTHTQVFLMNHLWSLHPREVKIWVSTVFILISQKTEIARSAEGPKLQGLHAEDAMAKPLLRAEKFGHFTTAKSQGYQWQLQISRALTSAKCLDFRQHSIKYIHPVQKCVTTCHMIDNIFQIGTAAVAQRASTAQDSGILFCRLHQCIPERWPPVDHGGIITCGVTLFSSLGSQLHDCGIPSGRQRLQIWWGCLSKNFKVHSINNHFVSNIFLSRLMQSYDDGEAMGTLHSGACEGDWAQPREKSCGAERHHFAPSHKSQSVATAFISNRVWPGSIAKDIAQRQHPGLWRLPPSRPKCNFIHPRQLSHFLERLELPFSSE